MKENASFNDVKIGQKLFVNSRLTYQNNPQLTTEENATWERIEKNTAGDKTAAQVLNFGAQRGCQYACDEVLGSASWEGNAVCVMNANSCPKTPKGYVSCNTDECYQTTKKNMPCENVFLYDGGKTGCSSQSQGTAYYTLKEYYNSQLHPNEYLNWDTTKCKQCGNDCLVWVCDPSSAGPESHCTANDTPLDNQACSTEGDTSSYATCEFNESGTEAIYESYSCECQRTTNCGSSSNSGRWSCSYCSSYASGDYYAPCPNNRIDGDPCSDIGATSQETFPSDEGPVGTNCAVYNCVCQ